MRPTNQQFSSILTKIRKREQLDEMEITLTEFRFCTVEETEARFVLRFARNAENSPSKGTGPLTSELTDAEQFLIRKAQDRKFS
ncbi:hypothetical protein TNCV_2444641 [Trichonephila clavipes]|nr:hypothetical protein TNCV_2444641 [Trichonephila clavipes]